MERLGSAGYWGWFAAWVVVGAAYGIGFLSFIGLFVLPIAILLTIFLARTPASRPSSLGLLSGMGFPLLYIAYLNRGGPGDVCRPIPHGTACTSADSPWPWVWIGVSLVVAGLALAIGRLMRGSRSVSAPAPTLR